MELISIPTVPKVRALLLLSNRRLKLKLSKYRDPLHVILEYIAEVRAVGTKLAFSLYVGTNLDCIGETQLRSGHSS